MSGKSRGEHLKVLKQQQSEKNLKEMEQAIKRYEIGKLQKLPKGSKLTRRNLSIEAGVSKDTPFSRYRKNSENAGQYRYPSIVNQFSLLREKVNKTNDADKKLKEKLKEKSLQIQQTQTLLSMSRNVVNAQDILIDKLQKDLRSLQDEFNIRIKNYEDKITELYNELAELKRNNLRIYKSRT